MKGFLSLGLAIIFTCPAVTYAFTGNDIYSWGLQFEKENETPVSASSFGYLGYVAGAVDAMNDVLFCAPRTVTYSQAGSILMKYLKNNPEERNKHGTLLVIAALSKPYPCPK